MDETGRRQEERSIDVLSDNFTHTVHIFLVVVIILALLLLVCMGVIVYQHKQHIQDAADIKQLQSMYTVR